MTWGRVGGNVGGMKAILVAGLCVIGSAVAVPAQNFDATTGSEPVRPGTVRTPDEVRLKPRPTGVIYIMSSAGLQVINPLAPESVGRAESVVAASTSVTTRQADAVEDHKPFGGIHLFGWEF